MAKFILKKGDEFVESMKRVWRYSDKTGIIQRTIDVSVRFTDKEKKAEIFKSKEVVEELIAVAKQSKDINLYMIQIEM